VVRPRLGTERIQNFFAGRFHSADRLAKASNCYGSALSASATSRFRFLATSCVLAFGGRHSNDDFATMQVSA
jgi:hypothetical protein